MTKRLLLMPGTSKTGTTSIQNFLAQNSTRLREFDIEYPLQLTAANHHLPLVDGLLDKGASCEHLQTLDSLDASVVILNSEHFDLRFSDDLLAAIRSYLLPLFDETKIVLVLRDPLSYAQSSYCEAIKWWCTDSFEDFFRWGYAQGYLDYYSRTSKWKDLGDQVSVSLIDYNSSKNIIMDALDHPDLGLTKKVLASLEGCGARLNASPSIDSLLVFQTLAKRLGPELIRERYLQFASFIERLDLPEQRSKWRFPESLVCYVDELNRLNRPLLTFADMQGSFSWAEDLTSLFVELSQRQERSIEDIVGELMDAISSQFSEAS